MVWHRVGHRNKWGTEVHSLIHHTVGSGVSVVIMGLASHGGDSLDLDGYSDAGPPERKASAPEGWEFSFIT